MLGSNTEMRVNSKLPNIKALGYNHKKHINPL